MLLCTFDCTITLFGRQHAKHAESGILLAIPSVCPTSAGAVSKRMYHIVTLLDDLIGSSLLFLELHGNHIIHKGNHRQGR